MAGIIHFFIEHRDTVMTHSPTFYATRQSLEQGSQFYFFFDMDGTLCDSEGIYALALQATISDITGIDISFDEACEYALGRSINDVLNFVFTHFNVDPSMQDKFLSTIVGKYSALKLENADKFLISPTVNLFKQLVDEGYPVCIVSGSTREDISAVLRLMNVDKEIPYFGNEDYHHGKPNPEPYLTAAKYFDIASDEYKNIIIIEDSPVGVRAGHAAGMHVIGLQASSLPGSLYDEGAHLVFAKKDIGAEMGGVETVNLTTSLKSYLLELTASREKIAFSFA